MNKILRLALCGEVEQSSPEQAAMQQLSSDKPVKAKTEDLPEQTIVMSGPLSEVYTKALQVVFSRNNSNLVDKADIKESDQDDEESLATESQVMMAAALAGAAQMKKEDQSDLDYIKGGQAAGKFRKVQSKTVVFVTDIDSVTPETIITAQKGMNNHDRCIVVLDGTKDAANTEPKAVYMSQLRREAFKRQCEYLNVKLLFSMEQLIEELNKY